MRWNVTPNYLLRFTLSRLLVLMIGLGLALPAAAQRFSNPLSAVKPALQRKLIKEEYAEALPELNRLLQTDSLNPNYLYLRAECRMFFKEHEAALLDYNKAERFAPNDGLLLASRGAAYMQLRRFPEALTDLNQAATTHPRQPLVFLCRGVCRLYTNDLPGALLDLNKAVEFGPNEDEVWTYRCIVQMVAGRYTEAKFSSAEQIRRHPKDPYGYANRALLQLIANNTTQAKQDAEQALKLKPADEQLQLISAFVAEKSGKQAQAQQRYDELAAKATSKGWLYLERGDLHMQTGNIAGATADWQRAADLGNTEAAERISAGFQAPLAK
ncbi:tetratricopeptide repeat protein [Solirubrum puertoriconensis]|uniref:Tetratricopeptide repeat protein n=1 Tax=Solirubrum puertoriconensis TaxID=1751427 RepID=A0A9X0HKF4_SOLP1|nr:tetratricopeptide repeat protein [Solirubrum puertoriconensis]KUG07561.1 hypothetical protein ASU33_14590 [Solirubrum puertoriconensis]